MGFDDILLDFMPYKMDYNGVKLLVGGFNIFKPMFKKGTRILFGEHYRTPHQSDGENYGKLWKTIVSCNISLGYQSNDMINP